MGLREQRERVMIDGLGNVGAGKFVARTKIAEDTNQSSSITPITDDAIKRLPKVTIPGYTDEQCECIHKHHKQLLTLARDTNDGKEVAFVLSKDFSEKSIDFGENDNISFRSRDSIIMMNSRRDLFVMHNHPHNSSFSDTDIFLLLKDNIRSISVVKHNGGIEVLTKTEQCDIISMTASLRKISNRYGPKSPNYNKAKYNNAIKKYINAQVEKGELVWIRK